MELFISKAMEISGGGRAFWIKQYEAYTNGLDGVEIHDTTLTLLGGE